MAKDARIWVDTGGRPALVLGRAQRRLVTGGPLPVRWRASGGGAVLAGPWLLRAALRLPRQHPALQRGPTAAAHWFGQIHLDWLRAQGIAGAALHTGALRSHWACFAGVGPGEVLVDGRKLAGVAQAWKRHSAILFSGTLLAPSPWPLLCEALRKPPEEAAALRAATISAQECLGAPVEAAAWAASLRARLQAALAPPA